MLYEELKKIIDDAHGFCEQDFFKKESEVILRMFELKNHGYVEFKKDNDPIRPTLKLVKVYALTRSLLEVNHSISQYLSELQPAVFASIKDIVAFFDKGLLTDDILRDRDLLDAYKKNLEELRKSYNV